jgi:hypothetical protein
MSPRRRCITIQRAGQARFLALAPALALTLATCGLAPPPLTPPPDICHVDTATGPVYRPCQH